jgi:hypothetical protein
MAEHRRVDRARICVRVAQQDDLCGCGLHWRARLGGEGGARNITPSGPMSKLCKNLTRFGSDDLSNSKLLLVTEERCGLPGANGSSPGRERGRGGGMEL